MAHLKTSQNGGVRVTRREFLSWTWWGIVGLIALESTVGLLWALWAKKPKVKPGQFGSNLSAGNINEMQVGDIKLVEKGKFFISKVEENGVLALYRKCPHLGCPVPWAPDEPTWDSIQAQGKFHCRCHGSEYDRFGVKHAGPAPRPMDLMAGEIDAQGNILIDTGNISTRSGYNESQLIRKA
ncbi:MAG: cytochrome B6 [Dehalococcoidia bacterium]|nr:cytochrome B6 [Dehalococcoidia bacterium]